LVPLPFVEADKKGTIYDVTCQDINGNKISKQWIKGSGKKGDYGYLDGMKPEPK
jgi:hypothetical protein